MSRGASRAACQATPEDTRSVLRAFHIRPTKRWGQHFLVSQRAMRRMLDAASLDSTDSVLEVGAGIGTLTVALAGQSGWVTAIEIDRRLLPALAAATAPYPNVRIVAGDALDVDLSSLFSGPVDAPRKAVANLPYNVAAPLLMRLLAPALRLRLVVVTVQREVAQRITAAPASEAYGRLSLAIQYRATAVIVSRVRPGAFLPPPEVESAIVKITPCASPRARVPDEAEFFRIVAAGFGHRRKTLVNALTDALDLPRAETLGLEAFAALAQALHPALADASSTANR